jgi:hypothetical protein
MTDAILLPVMELDGTISALTIDVAGSGYSSVPLISINPPASGTQATATCTLSGGSIATTLMTNNGSGYDPLDPPLVSVIRSITPSLNLTTITGDVTTLQTNVDFLDSIVGQNTIGISALDSSVTALQGFSTTGVEGSVVFEGAVNDLLADQNRFIYNRTTHVLSLEQPIVCSNPATTSTQLTRKGEIDTALGLKANLESPTFTGTVGGITSSMVGLGNVDNTSDADKPVSTATQNALDLKANLSRTLYANTYFLNAGVNTLSSILTTIGSSSDQTILVSSSTHTVGDTSITVSNFTMCTVDGATVQPASFNGAITLNGATQTRVRVSNIQFNSLFTVSGTAGRHNFRCCNFTAGFTVAGATTNWINFTNCSFGGTLTVPNTFAGSISFNQCDFAGTTLSLNNASPLQVLFSLCSNLPSFTLNGTLVGFNSTSSASRTDSIQLFQNGNQVITTYDAVPTSGSTNILRSGGIFTALADKANLASPTFTGILTTPNLTIPSLSSATTSNVLYYNTGTGVVSQGTLSAGTPAGSNTQVQFNSAGAFRASANLTFNNVTNILSTNGIVCNNLTANSLANVSTANAVYYNTTTGVLTYGATGSGGTPGGSNTQVQYNNSGAFAGDAGFTFNAGTDTLTVNTNIIGPDLRCNPASGSTDFANFQAPQGISLQGNAGNYALKIISPNTNTCGISFSNTAAAGERAGFLYTHSTNVLSVRSNGAERMTIGPSNTVINTPLTLSGIGTGTASNILYINAGVVTSGSAPGSFTTATVTSSQPAGSGNFRTGPGQVWNGVGAQQMFLASSTGTQLGSGFQTNQNDVFFVPPGIRVYANSNAFTWWQFT